MDQPRSSSGSTPGRAHAEGSGGEAPRRAGGARLAAGGAVLAVVGGLVAAGLLLRGAGPNGASATPGAVGKAGDPRALAAALDAARSLMTRSEWAKAEAVLREASAKFPDDQEARVGLAEALLGQRKVKEAYEQYEKALAIGPRDAGLEFTAGQVASQAGLNDRAIEHFSMVQSKDPKNAAAPLRLGLAQRQAGQNDAAKASLLRAANMDPDAAMAWGTLADIALSENKVDLALQHVAKARALQPESAAWRVVEARGLARQGAPERALMTLLAIDAEKRRDPPVLRLVTQCYGMLGKHAEAGAAWAEAYKADPGKGELAYEAALSFERAGDAARARELARAAQAVGHAEAAALVERLK